MKKKAIPRLLASELEILEMLWRMGPVSILEAQRALETPHGYTTIQTRLNRLVAKRLVHKTTQRPAKYTAAIARAAVTNHDLNVLVDQVNAGRIVPLVAHLVKDRQLLPDEIRELKRLIEDVEIRNRRHPGAET